jgi:DNA ligase-1
MLTDSVYDPSHRNNLSFASIRKHISENKMSTSCITASSITELLDMLSTRQVTGNVARDLVLQFLIDHDILGEGFDIRQDRADELETFGRILDRNLVAGFGARTLSSIDWNQASNPSLKNTETLIPTTKEKAPGTIRRNLESFPVALGKSIEPPFTEIAKSSCTWYASRKLDGVRVITFLDFLVPADSNGPISFQSAQFFSRTGKPFTSLSKVEDHLKALERFPNLQQWLGGEAGDSASVIDRTDEGLVRRLVLDGEICVMRQKHGEPTKRPDEVTGAAAIWSDDNLEEDFPSTVSEIRRGAPFTIPHPVYFIFDILPYDLFEAAKGPSRFGQRVNDIRDLGRWLAGQKPEERVLRPLTQWEVKDGTEIDGMVARAAEEGWEGLVLRADKPYKGSRS